MSLCKAFCDYIIYRTLLIVLFYNFAIKLSFI